MNGPSISKAAVIGAGSWGTAVANLVAVNVPQVVIWGRDPDVIADINNMRCNRKFLPGLQLLEEISATLDYDAALPDAQLIVWAIPVQFTRARLRDCVGYVDPDATIINLSKGLEGGTCYRPSQIIAQVCPGLRHVGSLGGGNVAAEIAAGMPAEAALAVTNHWEIRGIERVFTTPRFAVRLQADLTALELAGALKNIIAIGVGLCDGLALGENCKGSLIARGFGEIRLLGSALGANPEAFTHPYALGDLIATCNSGTSRNRLLGEHIGRGSSLEKAATLLGGRVAEGAATLGVCVDLANKLNLSIPLICGLDRLIKSMPSATLRSDLQSLLLGIDGNPVLPDNAR